MRCANLFLISDDLILAKSVCSSIEKESNCSLTVEADPDRAIDLIKTTQIDLLIVHQSAEKGVQETVSLLKSLATPSGLLATIVICESASAAQTEEFIDCGVIECLPIPFDVRRLSNLISILTSRGRLTHEHSGLTDEDAFKRDARVAELSVDDSKWKFLFGTSGDFADLMEQVRRVAPTMTTVLLLGETGVGKTCIANVLHRISSRHDEPFIAVNCGALSPGLIESELLGHAKGAFTGALKDHDGRMKLAGRGTLLLDEIDSLPMVAQASLLRAIDERVFEPVGSDRTQRFEARLIVATNRDLQAEVAARRFREDLYYRINVVSFHLPPLRERRELIQSLAQQFLAEFAERDGKSIPKLSQQALTTLKSFDWPGNIRELRNVIERASSLCRDDVIVSRDLFPGNGQSRTNRSFRQPAASDPMNRTLQQEDEEIEVIRRALANANNNRAKAARELGMSRVTFYKKLHKHNLAGFK